MWKLDERMNFEQIYAFKSAMPEQYSNDLFSTTMIFVQSNVLYNENDPPKQTKD